MSTSLFVDLCLSAIALCRKRWYISIVFGIEASTKRIKRRKELSHKKILRYGILYFRVTQNMYDNVEDHVIESLLIMIENPLLIMIVYEIHHTFRVITTLQQQQYLLIKNLKDPMVTVYTMQTRTRRGRSYYKEEISKLILDQMLPILI